MPIYQFDKLPSNIVMTTINEIRRANLILLKGEFRTYAEIAKRANTDPAYLSQILSTKNPRNMGDDVARHIEEGCGKPVGWMDKYHGVVNEDKIEYGPLRIIVQNTEIGPDIRGRVPLISFVQAGMWCETIDIYHVGDAEAWMPCPVSHGPRTYCLRVQGDSMTNTMPGQKSYPEGTIIFVDPDRPVTNGSRVIARLADANEATFKEYREDGGRRFLKPLNQQYQMQEITDGVIICGVVIFSGLPE